VVGGFLPDDGPQPFLPLAGQVLGGRGRRERGRRGGKEGKMGYTMARKDVGEKEGRRSLIKRGGGRKGGSGGGSTLQSL
jgi:hypothetical protein